MLRVQVLRGRPSASSQPLHSMECLSPVQQTGFQPLACIVPFHSADIHLHSMLSLYMSPFKVESTIMGACLLL